MPNFLYRYFVLSAIKCTNVSFGCNPDTSQTELEYNLAVMNVLLVEGYYDHTSQSDPVKYKLNLFNPLELQFNSSVTKTYKMKQNKVKKLDGSIEQFVSYEAKEVLYYDLTSVLASFYFEMADNYDYYETYIDYQPVIDSSSRRNLEQHDSSARNLEQEESSSNKDLMSGGYFVFFVMAQMGGLYTFLKLVFGLFVHHFNTQSLNHKIMNQVHENNKLAKAQETKYDESNKGKLL